ncbi:MAG: hypothetical protein JXA89_16120 [Anaerolineae bacterium]|nr:hypothetical protein [Anaerolineae bacterium]
MPRLHEAKEMARLLVRPGFDVYRLQGHSQGGPLTVVYAGLEYSRPFLQSILFADAPVETRIGAIPFWRVNDLLADALADMVIVEASKHVVARLPNKNAMILPQLVEHIVNAQGDWENVRSGFRKSVRKNELRWMRKYGYEYGVSHDAQAFEAFYDQMYLPTMDDRHGDLSSPMSFSELYQYFRYGMLFKITRDSDWVSGVVCYPQQDMLVAKALGVRNADSQLIHEGATAAIYYAAIHWANQNGYRAVNFLGSGAHLSRGLFQHKRKWGSTILVSPTLYRQIWIGVQHLTPAVSQFLKENPFVIVSQDGALHGQIIVDDLDDVPDATVKEWVKNYATPGMSSLFARSIRSLSKDVATDQDRRLDIPLLFDA